MASTATIMTVSTMNGIFKVVYGPRVEYAYPNGVRLIKDIPFEARNSQGSSFDFPVVLAHEGGFSFGAPTQTSALTLQNPVSAQSKNATVQSYEVILNSELTHEAAARASSGGTKAFVQATKHLVQGMTDAHRKMLEVQALYGRADLGVVATDGGTTQTISAATWAPGIWAGMEGARVDFLTSDLATERTANNPYTITAVDMANRTITLDNDPVTTAGDRIFFAEAVTAGGTPTYYENIGIHTALTTSGSVWGISNSSYNLWKPSTVSAGSSQLLFDHVQEASARVAEKGGIDGRNVLYVSNLSWIDLLGDQAALRRYDSADGTSRYDTGAEAICFYTATGKVDIVPSIYVKRGFAYLLNLDVWSRTGAMDFRFGDPVSADPFIRSETKATTIARSYSNVAVISRQLGRNCLINNIVNSAS